jgi:hypothetical protein
MIQPPPGDSLYEYTEIFLSRNKKIQPAYLFLKDKNYSCFNRRARKDRRDSQRLFIMMSSCKDLPYCR